MKINNLIIVVGLLLIFSQSFGQKNEAQIIVDKNILVGTDGNFQHGEIMFSANPKNPKMFVGASMIMNTGLARIYLSKDGGKSWDNVNLPEVTGEILGGDPQTAFSSNGTAYVSFYGEEKDNDKNHHQGILFYKSTDEGKTWEKSLSENLWGILEAHDHPQLAVDKTNGKFSGNIYINALSNENIYDLSKKNIYSLYLFRSSDAGKSFTKPRIVVSAEEGGGVNAQKILISSKGTIFFTYNEWCNDKSLTNHFNPYKLNLVLSKDGGNTFSSPKKIAGPGVVNYQFAIDNSNKKFKDRLYCVFSKKEKNKKSGLMVTYSKDEGETWSEPKLINGNHSDSINQSMPDIIVNKDGIVGIRFYGGTFPYTYDEYFTASTDGGETFLPPVKVSNETSRIPENNDWVRKKTILPIWRRTSDRSSIILDFLSASGPGGSGDFNLFTVDANGVFHDFWVDHRNKIRHQIYTSAIKVIESGVAENKKVTYVKMATDVKSEEEMNEPSKSRNLEQISRYVYLHFDPTFYDTTTNTFTIRSWIENISDQPIYGTIKLKISKIDTSEGKYTVPVILNSYNNKHDVGAEFWYSLNGSNVLQPGEKTDVVIWKLNVKIPNEKRGPFTEEMKKNIKLPLTEEQMKRIRIDNDVLIQYGFFPELIADLYLDAAGYMGESTK